MPLLTRWHIKSAFLYLATALLLGVALALAAVMPMPNWLAFLSPAFFHLIMVGWVTQMIIGVVFWMFPIISRARPRGYEGVGWAVYGLLNTGLLLRVLGEPLDGLYPEGVWGWGLVLSAILQWLAGVLFVFNAWPRVKERYRGE